MNKKILFLCTFWIFIFQGTKARASSANIENVTAKAVSQFLSSVGTFSQFLSLLEANLHAEEATAIRDQFVKLGIDLNAKIPSMVAVNTVIEMTGTNAKIEILNESEVKIKNKTYSALNQERLSIQLKKFIAHLQNKHYTYLSYLLPEAHAISDVLQSKPVAMGAMIAGYIATISALGWVGGKLALSVGFGMVGLPAIALGGLVWLGVELYQTFRDDEVTCSGKHFVLRKKARTLGIAPTSEVEVIDIDKVKALLKKPEINKCTDRYADDFQSAIKNRIVKADESLAESQTERNYRDARKRLFKEEAIPSPPNSISEPGQAR